MADQFPVSVAGLLMDNVPDGDGVRWRINDIDGWDSSPVRVDDSDRTGVHGGYGPARLYAARPLTLAGRALCPDMGTAHAVRDRVVGLIGPAVVEDLQVFETVPKRVAVRLNGEVRASWPSGAQLRVKFQIPVVAHDPFKRAVAANAAVVIAAGATEVVANGGNAAADLHVTLTSGGTVVLTAGGLTLRTGVLPSGAVIDTGTDTVRSSTGVDLSTLVVSPWQSPAVPVGGGPVHQAGTANLSVVSFDTYA